MSGGVVYWVNDNGKRLPIGITIHLNSPADLDGKGLKEDGMNFTSLYHVWAALKGEQMRYSSIYVANELVIGEPPAEDDGPPPKRWSV